MGLFGNNEDTRKQEKRPVNPNNMVAFRLLAIGYLLWSQWKILKAYLAGGEDAPSMTLLVVSLVIFVGGSAWIAWITYRQWKQLKAVQMEEDEDEEDEEDEEEDT